MFKSTLMEKMVATRMEKMLVPDSARSSR